MGKFRTWLYLGIIAVLGLAIGAGAVVLFVKHERTAQASALPNAARIDHVNGEVGLNRTLDNNSANTQWVRAEQNTPVSVGDRIYTKEKSDASIAFTGRNSTRLNEDTSLDVLALTEDKTQVALRDGTAMFEIGNLSGGEVFEVATPCGAVDLTEPGLYQVVVNDDGDAEATALSGVAQVVSERGSGRIDKGEVLTVPCQGGAGSSLSRVEPKAAGSVVDGYYRYRYPRTYDGRYVNYDRYLDDPLYYDPLKRFVSYQYVSDYVPGVDDLDSYGDWQDVSGYGHCWHPRVESDWAPYQSGYWSTDYPYGLTWVSSEPWGYAPYHYGRWTFTSNQWFWVPDGVRTRPRYSPALVAFIPLPAETVGWVALGPGDPYAPRYYSPDWTPRYLTRTQVVQERVSNFSVPGALTIVNVRNFNHFIDRRTIERVDVRQIVNVRPVLDPFAMRNLREVALRAREGERRFDLPARYAQRGERPVIASAIPVTPFRADLAQRLQVRSVPDKVRGDRLQFKDNRQSASVGPRSAPPTIQPNPGQAGLVAEMARERQLADLSRASARGDRQARQQLQQLRMQQQQERKQERDQVAMQQRAQRMAAQGAPGERVINNGQPSRGMAQQRSQPPAASPQSPRANRGSTIIRGNPQANGESGGHRQQQTTLRHVQRPPQPQAQPRDRQRYLGPPLRQPANRAQPPRPQAMPQPRVLREPRQRPQPQPRAQPQPQVQRQPGQVRQQPQPKPQPPNQQQQGGGRRQPSQPPAAPTNGQPQKKGGKHPS